jgi:hypothetical protein
MMFIVGTVCFVIGALFGIFLMVLMAASKEK